MALIDGIRRPDDSVPTLISFEILRTT
jgi:hypothetical protein